MIIIYIIRKFLLVNVNVMKLKLYTNDIYIDVVKRDKKYFYSHVF